MPASDQKFSEFIGYRGGQLMVESVSCAALVEAHGSPLYALSEAQIVHNFSAIKDAFCALYPQTDVLFAVKANNNPSILRLLARAGAGAECNGIGSLLAALDAGMRLDTTVLNGWPKTEREIELAIRNGIKVHLDGVDEFDVVANVATKLQMPAKIGIRNRLMLHELDLVDSDWPGPGVMASSAGVNMRWRNKDGISEADISALYKEIDRHPLLALAGLHHHIGRMRGDSIPVTAAIDEQLAVAGRLRDEFGWLPEYIDVGGGVPYGRPEGHGPYGVDRGESTYASYAEDVTAAFIKGLDAHDLGRPRLVIEPGRGMTSNAGVLLTQVKGIKCTPETRQTWVGVDASLTHLPMAFTSGWYYHLVPVVTNDKQVVDRVNVVDLNPWYGNLSFGLTCQPLETGDALAFLDTGSYCESMVQDFNLIPRPATVLVSGINVDVISRRETFEDLRRRAEVPTRLKSRSESAANIGETSPPEIP